MSEAVDHPKHYTSDPSGIECIQVTRHRNFNVGNAIKYLWRAGMKQDPDRAALAKHIEDLEKARWYIADEIGRLRALEPLVVQPERLTTDQMVEQAAEAIRGLR